MTNILISPVTEHINTMYSLCTEKGILLLWYSCQKMQNLNLIGTMHEVNPSKRTFYITGQCSSKLSRSKKTLEELRRNDKCTVGPKTGQMWKNSWNPDNVCSLVNGIVPRLVSGFEHCTTVTQYADIQGGWVKSIWELAELFFATFLWV